MASVDFHRSDGTGGASSEARVDASWDAVGFRPGMLSLAMREGTVEAWARGVAWGAT